MKNDIFFQARSIIGDLTPLKADCGLICDKACCKGDEKTGMLLFPGEETVFETIGKDNLRLCVCKGKCDRDTRPLSCMIFPFFPYMTKDGKIKAVTDTRGITVCPMISHEKDILFSKLFIRRVSRVGRLLKKDEKCRQFLWETSREIDKLNLLYK